ncbi:hypothetical protein PVAP13_2KG221366 [Panicum virgatum]|uniref:Uncharacterized protein n=1 Tax=Panicum virgatum TaxID=38727 RepID=A0A8T0WFP2_PANVG|nr:hypothetical protein PVAP13_2KG221366 [Panicum virgatum]
MRSTYCSPGRRIVVSTPTHHSSLEATSSPRHPSLPSSLQQARGQRPGPNVKILISIWAVLQAATREAAQHIKRVDKNVNLKGA